MSPPVSEPKQGPRLVEAKQNPDPVRVNQAGEVIDENAEVPGPAPKEEPKAAEKPKQATAKGKGTGKGIFAQASKPKTTTPVKPAEEKRAENEATAAAETPTAETGNQDEQPIPDQETPAEEAAREQTQAVRDPFAGDEPGQEDGQDGELASEETDDLVKAVAGHGGHAIGRGGGPGREAEVHLQLRAEVEGVGRMRDWVVALLWGMVVLVVLVTIVATGAILSVLLTPIVIFAVIVFGIWFLLQVLKESNDDTKNGSGPGS